MTDITVAAPKADDIQLIGDRYQIRFPLSGPWRLRDFEELFAKAQQSTQSEAKCPLSVRDHAIWVYVEEVVDLAPLIDYVQRVVHQLSVYGAQARAKGEELRLKSAAKRSALEEGLEKLRAQLRDPSKD